MSFWRMSVPAAALVVLALVALPTSTRQPPEQPLQQAVQQPVQQSAQQATQVQKPFEPRVGQAGKDVVWVPTPQALVDTMLEMAKVTPNDFLMDLGSGDGITVISAAKRGVKALGIEYNPDMVELSRKNAFAAGVSALATFERADRFQTDLSRATVITMFLLPSINMKLRPTLLDLRPGTRIVSNTFTMEDWEPDEKRTVENCERWCTALLWIVPAKVAGTWRIGTELLTLTQHFQQVTGTLDGKPLVQPTLRGSQLTFTVDGTRYTGQVVGNRMQGSSAAAGRTVQWTATRS